jgi:hypothetical protein
MAPKKEGSRIRRKARAGRTVEKKAGQGGGVTLVDIDPWGSFFEMFLGQVAEGESNDRHEGGREPAKGRWTAGEGARLRRHEPAWGATEGMTSVPSRRLGQRRSYAWIIHGDT